MSLSGGDSGDAPPPPFSGGGEDDGDDQGDDKILDAFSDAAILADFYEQGFKLAKRAVEGDIGGLYEESWKDYAAAAQFLLEAVRLEKQMKPEPTEAETAKMNAVRAKVLEYINRSEELSKISKATPRRVSSKRQPHTANSEGTSGSLTKAEIEILKETSYVNGKLYLPFLEDIDASDFNTVYNTGKVFEDPDGIMTLAPKQKESFTRWGRIGKEGDVPGCFQPYIYYQENKSNENGKYPGEAMMRIKQTVISDCSFVASLCVCVEYERRFPGRNVLSHCIYPKQRLTGEPMVNSSGKYVVKLHINGISRKVVIDDRLPVGEGGRLLCSHSLDRNEMYVSLLEKAYMKVMGGYNFPGSNSNIDLHAMTGWIPERAAISEMTSEVEAQQLVLWRRAKNGFEKGECLVTLASRPLSEAEEERTGLVSSHAYAVLDIRQECGKLLMKLKNPWSHTRWKGHYGVHDKANWSIELQKALGYDRGQEEALATEDKDDGVFWINYKSVCHFYNVIYMNWNPMLFKYRYTLHRKWPANSGPQKDSYNMEYNPQYCLSLKFSKDHIKNHTKALVWILLTKHITKIEDFADNQDFIGVHVYNAKSGGNRIYYPDDMMQIEAVKINSPHYLAQLEVEPPKTGDTTSHTLVISQYQKLHSICYTLKLYGNGPFSLQEVKSPYTKKKKILGQWTTVSAGGCGNHWSFANNPQYKFTVKGKKHNTMFKLEAPKSYAVNILATRILKHDRKKGSKFAVDCLADQRLDTACPEKSRIVCSSNAYRPGFCYTTFSGSDMEVGEEDNYESSEFVVTLSTYEPQQLGAFFFTVASDCEFSAVEIPGEGDGLDCTQLNGEWNQMSAGGNPNLGRFASNPCYLVSRTEHGANKPLKFKCRVVIPIPRNETGKVPPPPSLNVAVIPFTDALPNTIPKDFIGCSGGGGYVQSFSGVCTPLMEIPPKFKKFYVVVSTYNPVQAKYELNIFSEKDKFKIERVGGTSENIEKPEDNASTEEQPKDP
eukprot:Nk52_evm11s288 gene=Nk52_evmTU11s288